MLFFCMCPKKFTTKKTRNKMHTQKSEEVKKQKNKQNVWRAMYTQKVQTKERSRILKWFFLYLLLSRSLPLCTMRTNKKSKENVRFLFSHNGQCICRCSCTIVLVYGLRECEERSANYFFIHSVNISSVLFHFLSIQKPNFSSTQ